MSEEIRKLERRNQQIITLLAKKRKQIAQMDTDINKLMTEMQANDLEISALRYENDQ